MNPIQFLETIAGKLRNKDGTFDADSVQALALLADQLGHISSLGECLSPSHHVHVVSCTNKIAAIKALRTIFVDCGLVDPGLLQCKHFVDGKLSFKMNPSMRCRLQEMAPDCVFVRGEKVFLP